MARSTARSGVGEIGWPTVLWQSMQSMVRRVPAPIIWSVVSGARYSFTWPFASVTLTYGIVWRSASVATYSTRTAGSACQ